jgi:hypothetical protein
MDMKRVLVGVLVLCGVAGSAVAQQWQPISGAWGGYVPDLAMDNQGNVHLVYVTDYWDVRYARWDAQTQEWSYPLIIPQSTAMWELFGRPKVAVGPNGIPHVVWANGDWYPFYHPSDLMYAHATSPAGTSWIVQNLDPDWVASPDIAVDDQNNPHFVFQRVLMNPDRWYLIHRDLPGNETVIQWGTDEAWKPNFPAIEYGNNLVHVPWEKGDGDRGNIYYANSSNWGDIQQLTYNSWGRHPTYPHCAVSPVTGKAGVVCYIDDWSSGAGYHTGVYYSEPGGPYGEQLWSCWAWLHEPRTAINDDWFPHISFDSQGTRYVVWSVYNYDRTYYKEGDLPAVELDTAGHVTVAGGVNGAMMVRAKPTAGQLYWLHLGGGPVYYPPTAQIDNITPNPAYQQQDVVSFSGSAWDNDENGESIEQYQWRSDRDGVLASTEDFDMSADLLSLGAHVITFEVWDDEGQTDSATASLTISQLYDPSAVIESIDPNPATQQVDVVHFEGDAWDNDEGQEAIVAWLWTSDVDGELAYTEDFDLPAANLTDGTHLITFKVEDDDGQTAQDTMTLVVTPPPQPPTAVIDSIAPNPAVQDVDVVNFYGSAWDNDENGQSIVSYRWSSNLDGILSNQEDFTQPASGLSVGTHLMTFTVWDDESQTAQDTMSLVIEPSPWLPPTALIDSIVPSVAYHEVDTVFFHGSAWDNDENGESIETYQWASDIDGTLATTEDFSLVADLLSVGTHLVTFQVWDDESQTAQDTMTLVVYASPFQPPTALIDSIVPDTVYQEIDPVWFYGSAWDNDENGESIEGYQWTSDLDGMLALTEDFTLLQGALSVGTHLITFQVLDDEGETAEDTTSLLVFSVGSIPPTAVIDSIWPSPAMQQRDTVHFDATAWDNDATDTIVSYEWWSARLQQILSAREDFTLAAEVLPVGLNAVRFTAWDDEGDSAVAWGSLSIIDYTPVPAAPQQVVCAYESQADRAKLTWIGPLGATFNVYRDSTAYFTAASPVATGITTPPWYHDSPQLDRSHYYYVTSENIGGESGPSERVGLVPYELSP